MSAVLQVRVSQSEAASTPPPETVVAPADPGHDNPLQLIRKAIAGLNAPDGDLPDHTQMAGLLAEVREALERANIIARAVAESEELAGKAEFEKALRILDEGLSLYPGDPALVTRRRDVEERQRASQSAATVRTALEEAQWLLNQDRLDLAVNFLRQKAADFPDQPALSSRLNEIEALLPQWEQNRQVQAALGRVAALEDLQQWQVALTILEEALQSNSASAELTSEARRIRDRLAEQERQTRLARRLELIERKISAQSWKQAEALLESTQQEFPGAPEFETLRRTVHDSLKRAECDSIVTEARQCLADGELEQAEQFLRRGLASLGREPALEALQRELESERNYRDQLRTAQILFGRRQLVEAESVLSGLVDADRSEARLLLDAIRNARTETEEVNFCDRGRAQVVKMMQQQQFAQAIDLLHNLLSLFPGNPILERDLAAARNALGQESLELSAGREEETRHPEVPDPPAPVLSASLQARTAAPPVNIEASLVLPSSRGRRVAIAGAASVVLIAAGGAAWKFSANETPVSRLPAATAAIRPSLDARNPAAAPRPAEPVAPATPARQSAAAPPEISAKVPAQPPAKPVSKPEPAATADPAAERRSAQPETVPQRAVKAFVPVPTEQKPARAPVLSSPPEIVVVPRSIAAALPAGLVGPINPPAPLPAAPVQPPAAAALPAPKAPSTANDFQDAQLIERLLPVYPEAAIQRHINGLVRLEATINERGAVKRVKVLSGDQVLAAAAMQAVMRWKYKPATLGGKPVPSTLAVQVEFRGDDARK